MRILSFDTSMSSPGASVIEVKNRKAKILDHSHIKTTTNQTYGLRVEIIESWATLFILKNLNSKGYHTIVREDFSGKSSKQNHPVFAAWGAVDIALNKFGLSFSTPAISQSRVKLLVVGKGIAEKEEVEEAVRKFTGYTGKFETNDESDAVAIGLSWALENGLIDDVIVRAPKPKSKPKAKRKNTKEAK